jgi:hypothetical protein
MPYNFEPAANVLDIRERQHATAAQIQFSAFTSCIGVIAKNGPMLTAVHLVMVAPDGTRFNRVTATRVIHEILPDQYECVKIIGCIAWWTNPANEVLSAFDTLRGQIRSLELVQLYPFAAGTYGADAIGAEIELTFI